VNQPATTVTVCAALFVFGALSVYINLFRPDLWLKMDRNRGNQQHQQRILKDELFVTKCRTAGVFGVIFIIVSGYGLLLNIPRLF
jgi:hypothetical protein